MTSLQSTTAHTLADTCTQIHQISVYLLPHADQHPAAAATTGSLSMTPYQFHTLIESLSLMETQHLKLFMRTGT